METYRAIVLSADMKTGKVLTDFLKNFNYDIIRTTQYGFDCLSEAVASKPDVILCDAFNFDFDAVSLHGELKDLDIADEIVFVVATSITDSSFINLALDSGVDIYTLLPTDFVSLDERIRNKIRAKRNKDPDETLQMGSDEFKIRTRVKFLAHEMGVSNGLYGYDYIIEGVYANVINTTGKKINVTTELYPYIAEKFNSTAYAVEGAIRSAIDTSWLHGNVNLINEIFGYSVDSEKARPTNAQYIRALADKIKTDLLMK